MVRALAIFFLLSHAAAAAETPSGLPTLAALSERAAKRFPQPVRAGDLIGRDVLEPKESQPVLGRVEALTRQPDGGLDFIIRAGAVLGLAGRLVAVPADAMALLGEYVALMDYTPAQLAALPTVQSGPGLGADETIKVGLVKPFH